MFICCLILNNIYIPASFPVVHERIYTLYSKRVLNCVRSCSQSGNIVNRAPPPGGEFLSIHIARSCRGRLSIVNLQGRTPCVQNDTSCLCIRILYDLQVVGHDGMARCPLSIKRQPQAYTYAPSRTHRRSALDNQRRVLDQVLCLLGHPSQDEDHTIRENLVVVYWKGLRLNGHGHNTVVYVVWWMPKNHACINVCCEYTVQWCFCVLGFPICWRTPVYDHEMLPVLFKDLFIQDLIVIVKNASHVTLTCCSQQLTAFIFCITQICTWICPLSTITAFICLLKQHSSKYVHWPIM